MEPICTNQIARIMLEGVQEVVGDHDLEALIRPNLDPIWRRKGQDACLSYDDLSQFQSVVERSYGVTGGRGVLLRSGRASFRRMLPFFWQMLGMTNLQYRLNPTPVRIRAGLLALAQVLTEMYGTTVAFGETDNSWMIKLDHCPHCYHRKSSGPICDYLVGLLQEYLAWTTSGRFYQVEEVECAGAGAAACKLRIMKKPLD